MNKVICIVGPTASGKTSLSVELAKEINGEIISADSMQIYKELSIGTAKVTKEEMQNIPHHLVDFVNITEEFSVANFKKLAIEKIDDILNRNKVPIIVGGTGLYVSSVINNMTFEDEEIDIKYREQLYALAKEKGNNYIHDMLKKIDLKAANDIHPNNVKRVIRALEMAKNNKIKTDRLLEDETKRKENSKYIFNIYCLNFSKEILYERINKRVDIMIKDGLEKEAKIVNKLNLGTLRQAIGYKEFKEYFDGIKSLDEVIEEIKLRTRQYSKRQLTWFKKIKNIKYLDALQSKKQLIADIKRDLYDKKEC